MKAKHMMNKTTKVLFTIVDPLIGQQNTSVIHVIMNM